MSYDEETDMDSFAKRRLDASRAGLSGPARDATYSDRAERDVPDRTDQWERLPVEHADFGRQCGTCHVVWLTESIARECETRHDAGPA
jgi:hypothetical protein